jgi:AAA+ ATPase superfamily predicted ATPase
VVVTSDEEHVEQFVGSGVGHPTLGLVYGRRRIGKSTLLSRVARAHGGFYWEATRSTTKVQLGRLGAALGAHLDVGPLSFGGWDDALAQLLRLGARGVTPVVLDEAGYVLEADRSVDSVVASALGPAARHQGPASQARLILCGSAIAMMRSLTAGEAPLRGRAGMELVMRPADFRGAAEHVARTTGGLDLETAVRVYAVIGGVIGYATDMVDGDLPSGLHDFDRWVAARILSPGATLHHEAVTLLSEDPDISTTNPVLHQSILAAIANGSVTAGSISRKVGRPVSNLDPALKRLVDAGFVVRHQDPIRAQRPQYALGDPFLQFHYAVLEPHGALLRARDPATIWTRRLVRSFDAQVRGPVFEEQARSWVERYADEETIGGLPDHVGPSIVVVDGVEHQIDVTVASSERPDLSPSARPVIALGEAKAGEAVGVPHLLALERARAAVGSRAAHAKLLLFATRFARDLVELAGRRHDVELVDLERLYHGS